LLKAAQRDALLALLQTMKSRSGKPEFFRELDKRHVATFLAEKRRELFFQSVTHPAMLANNLFRLRNKLLTGVWKLALFAVMKAAALELLAIGLGLFFTITSGAQPVITSQPVNPAVVWGGNATFSVMATGVGPLTYQWQLNGTNLPNNIITTVAGGNLFNNLQATNTILNSAVGVTKDSIGNLFIADYGNNVIRKVDTNGLTTIVAGNGSASYSGDGGAATNAGLVNPNAVIVDPFGNLLISDSGNNRIRKVDTNGIVSTVAGNGFGFPTFSGDFGAATNARINYPVGLCLDSAGNLFIADQQNHCIRKVNTSGIITTVAGIGGIGGYNTDNIQATSAYLSFPSGVFVDSSNNLFIADSSNHRVRKVKPSGIISTVAGTGTAGYSGDGGAATSAKINVPKSIAMDAVRNLYIADSSDHHIRKMDTNNIITTTAGSGTNGFAGDDGMATNANLSFPQSVAVDSLGNIFIADDANNRVRQVGTNGIITTVAGRNLNDGDFATSATLNLDNGIAVDSGGNLYIADNNNNRIRKVDTNGVITTVAGNGFYDYSGDGGAATDASLRHPSSVAVDAGGNLFIADLNNYRIRKVDTNGIISTVAGTGSPGFSGDGGAATNAKLSAVLSVAIDAAGNFCIADWSNVRVRKVDTNGVISTVAGTGSSGFSGDGGAATNAKIYLPQSVAFDSVGNLFIADNFGRTRKVDTNGIISTVAGNGTSGYSGDGGAATNASFNFPYGVASDIHNNLFITDSSNQRIRKVGTNGIISTVAGNGIQGFGGDGSSGNNASLSLPRGLAMDGVGNLFISDTGNNRIRKLAYVDFADQPFFTLTNVTPASLSNNYSVIITSSSGSVTSSVVTVNLQLPPITPVFTASNSVCTFTWSAVSNQTYQLQSATNLVAPNWTDLGIPITATNNSVSATDAVGSDGQRFYRVRLWP
jgi:trimeric autotransporter adhesin